MNKNIENITEELMMRYVEGDLDSNESEKFEKILSHNEYLSKRVNILKSISDKQPLKSPSRRVHNKILSDMGLPDNSSISIISETSHNFISNDLLLTQNDTSNGNVSYTVTYTGYDIYNNKNSLGRIISITQTSDFVFIKEKLEIQSKS